MTCHVFDMKHKTLLIKTLAFKLTKVINQLDAHHFN